MFKTIRQSVRQAANFAGVGIHRHNKERWEWSYTAEEYYPVTPAPRWGRGKPVHPQIAKLIAAQRGDISAFLDRVAQCDILNTIQREGDRNGITPFWNNNWFPYIDAAVLMTMLATKAPARYFEIGSGNSTKFARHTINVARLPTQIISMDPQPRAQIDAICDVTIRDGLENCDLGIFDQLNAGDILFFDGSHRAFTNSDVTVFFLELMPRLRPGVIIQIHDIFLPADYPPEWNRRMYSEQYLLGAMMLCPVQPFKILMPNYYASCDTQLRAKLPPLADLIGGSFWLEMK